MFESIIMFDLTQLYLAVSDSTLPFEFIYLFGLILIFFTWSYIIQSCCILPICVVRILKTLVIGGWMGCFLFLGSSFVIFPSNIYFPPPGSNMFRLLVWYFLRIWECFSCWPQPFRIHCHPIWCLSCLFCCFSSFTLCSVVYIYIIRSIVLPGLPFIILFFSYCFYIYLWCHICLWHQVVCWLIPLLWFWLSHPHFQDCWGISYHQGGPWWG